MTDYADLCKRLRGPDGRAEPLCGDAADAIEALQAELVRVMQAAANGGYCRQAHYPAGGTV